MILAMKRSIGRFTSLVFWSVVIVLGIYFGIIFFEGASSSVDEGKIKSFLDRMIRDFQSNESTRIFRDFADDYYNNGQNTDIPTKINGGD